MIKIGFFGTSDLAAHCLEGLLDDFKVLFVVTTEDRERGRNRKVLYGATKQFALDRNIDVLQPANLKDPQFIEQVRSYEADIFVVVAYGKLIPETVFDLPPLKTINLHPSLLPKYRGAAPMQWALINGEQETGVTVQLINEKLDAGDIVVQQKMLLDETVTAGELQAGVVPVSIDLLKRSVTGLANGTIVPVGQKHDEATFCSKIDRQLARIDWSKSPQDIHNLVRGLNPKPFAWTTFRDRHLQIQKTGLCRDAAVPHTIPGTLIRFQKKRLLAACGSGFLEIHLLKPESKKVLEAPAFINGYRLSENDRLI